MRTGNAIVDKIGELNFSGNIIPQNWYSAIKRETGKPYLAAIIILSDIVYWYRPTEIRDEQTGQIIEYRKKFREDKLQRSYQQIADMFGISKKDATNAVVFLEKLGVIKREFRTVSLNGIVANNVLFIDLVPEKLKEITYPDYDADNSFNEVTPIPQKSDRGNSKKGEVYAESEGTNTGTLTKNLAKTLTKTLQEDISTEFETLWKMYPRKLGKPKALKSYTKARKNGVTFEQVKQGIENYCKEICAKGTKMEYIKHGSTWFNGECWNDDYDFTPANQNNKTYGANGIAINPNASDDLKGIL